MRLTVAALVLICAAPMSGQVFCSYTVTPSNFVIGNQAYNGTIAVTPSNDSFCTGWSAAVAPGVVWLHLTPTAGNGAGTVTLTADPNLIGADRRAIITVAGTTITVAQSANTCIFSVSSLNASFPVSGGTGSFGVSANCSWQALSNDRSWITLRSPTSGITNGMVQYTIAPNACVAARSNTITVQTGLANPPVFAVSQDGAPSNMTLSSYSATVDAGASDGRVLVNTGTGCRWTAFSDVSWMQITNGLSSDGNGGVAYHILANSSAARTGSIHVNPAGVTSGLLLTITQPAAGPPAPVLTGILNAASYASGAVSAGEIVTIFGTNLGPDKLQLYQLTGGAFPTNVGGTQVLFDGSPAPMIYASKGQVSAVTPYAVDGKGSTKLQVQYQGAASSSTTVPVQATTPGIFSLDASGLGPGAILNQDFSINSVTNPAARGSVVSIYCTGGGFTNPATADGSITGTPLPMLTQNVMVTIGGISAKVDYSGGAPQAVAGLTQINVEVPGGVTPGPSVPVVLQIGNSSSQAGITMAVK